MAVATTPRWACWRDGSCLRISSSTVASEHNSLFGPEIKSGASFVLESMLLEVFSHTTQDRWEQHGISMYRSPSIFQLLTGNEEETWKYILRRFIHVRSWKVKMSLTSHSTALLLCYFHRDAKVPSPPTGHKWKEVRHDNKVTWLVSWTENIQGSIKYIMLNPSSRIKVRSS